MTDYNKKDTHKNKVLSDKLAKFEPEDPWVYKQNVMRAEQFVTPTRVEKNDKIEKLWSEFTELEKSNEFEKIIICMNSIIDLDPDNASALFNKASSLVNLAHEDNHYMEEAKKCYLKALEFKPDWYAAIVNLGNVYRDLGELEEAVKSYDKAIKLDPAAADPWLNKGDMLSASSNIEENKEAIECFDKAIELQTPLSSIAFLGKGQCYGINFNDAEKALECFVEGLANLGKMKDILPSLNTSSQIHIFFRLIENKGIALRLLKRYPEALNEFYKICQMGALSSQWPYPYYQMGITLEASDKDEEALDFYDDAIRILRKQPKSTDQRGAEGPEYPPESVALTGLPSIDLDTILIQKGHVLGNLGKLKDALKCFDDALELNPTADAWKGKGIVLTDLIVRQVNSNPELKSKHGKLNYDSNLREDILAKIGEAQACFEKVFEIMNPNATSDAVDDTEIHRATEVLLKILHLLPDDKK